MKLKRLWLPALGFAILLCVCAGTLMTAVFNRSGTPDSTLRLTERELALPTGSDFAQQDNTPLTLHLAWRVESLDRSDSTPAAASTTRAMWITRAKLEQLDMPTPAPTPTPTPAPTRVRTGPDNLVSTLLVLEFDGQVHARAVSRACNTTKPVHDERTCEFEVKKSSRLYVIDAGRTVAELRERYPDRTHFAIVPGVIRVSHETSADEFAGYIDDLSVDTVQGPEPLRSTIDSANGEMLWHRLLIHHEFNAVIAFGHRLEPWIVSIDGLADCC